MPSILVVDDVVAIHEMVKVFIEGMGVASGFATDGEQALVRYKTEVYDLVLADIDMKPMDGLTLLRQLRRYDPNVIVIIMTAYASTDNALQALKSGAFDFLCKPFLADELIATLRRGLEFSQLRAERALAGLAPGLKAEAIAGRLIGQSARMAKLVRQVKKLATVRSSVLLLGEEGTGRSVVAEILHGASGASAASFVRIDCSLGAEPGFRAVLLGQNGEGGTGVKQARGGTLFLQHVHRLAEPAQAELASVLRNTAHGYRLICATSENLEKLVGEGRFHAELFYRIGALPVQLPPLRERTADLPLLLQHYAAQAVNPVFGADPITFADDALAVLMAYDWPGNLTELRQMVATIAATTATRVITSPQLPPGLREPRHRPALAEYLAGQRKQYVDLVLEACHGDKAAAARVLGVAVSQLPKSD